MSARFDVIRVLIGLMSLAVGMLVVSGIMFVLVFWVVSPEDDDLR